MNQLLIPYLNPLKWHSITPVEIPQYITKYMDAYDYQQTIGANEEQTIWIQPWKKEDSIRQQMRSNYAPLTMKIYKIEGCTGRYVDSQVFDTEQEDFFRPGYFIRQIDTDLSPFDPGIYYCTINDLYISNIFEIREQQPGTILMEYSNYTKRGGVIFNSPTNAFQPSIRVPGKIPYNDTGSQDIVYEDDPLNETMIESIPFEVYDLFVGSSGAGDQLAGVPPWFMSKVKRIVGCSSLRVDGKYLVKLKDGKWENYVEDGTLLRGAKHEMREALNRDGLIFNDDVLIPGIAAAGLITDTKGFGITDNSNSDYLEIESVQ